MKKFSGITAVAASAFLSACFIAGCAESVSVEHGDIMLDNDVAPTLEASYAQYTQAAVDEYFAVAESHLKREKTSRRSCLLTPAITSVSSINTSFLPHRKATPTFRRVRLQH